MVEVAALAPNDRRRPKPAGTARHHAFADLSQYELKIIKLAWLRLRQEVWMHRKVEELDPGLVKVLRLQNGVLQFVDSGKKCHKASVGSNAGCRQHADRLPKVWRPVLPKRMDLPRVVSGAMRTNAGISPNADDKSVGETRRARRQVALANGKR